MCLRLCLCACVLVCLCACVLVCLCLCARWTQVCSEAFYNLLCHFDSRLLLLEKDLWWALMRLTKVSSPYLAPI